MKKKIMTLVLTTAMTAAAGLTAFAGEWKSNDTGWWWLNDDGSNPAAEWKWLDGNKDGTFECYYFGNDGYMLSDTTTRGLDRGRRRTAPVRPGRKRWK